jgi:hypothetical protein
MRKLLLLTILATLALGATSASSAVGAPVWNLDIHHAETNFPPGGGPGHIDVTTVTDGLAPATSEVQRIGAILATAGEYKLSFKGESTTDLPFNANGAAVQAALQALPSIGAGNLLVSGSQNAGASGGAHFDLTFSGALAAADQPQVTAADGTPRLSIAPELWFDVGNVGDAATSGLTTVTINLPKGLSRESIESGAGPAAKGTVATQWSCPGAAGSGKITCTTTNSIARHTVDRHLRLAVRVADDAVDPRSVSATVEGGGASNTASAVEPIHISSEPAGFGILPDSFRPGFFNADESTAVTQSGAHPDLFTTPIDFNTQAAPTAAVNLLKHSAGNVRDIHVDLPPGFLGNPTAVDECTQAQFTLSDCPVSSQVGRIDLRLDLAAGFGGFQWTELQVGLFNLSHPRGALADLGLSVASNPVHIMASLDPTNNYAITTTVADINETLPPMIQKLTVWGVPAEHSHDSERCAGFNLPNVATPAGDTSEECSTDHKRVPFLTVPFRCGVDNSFRLHNYDSWGETGSFGPDVGYALPEQTSGCDKPRFEPDVELIPTGRQANTPTGLDLHVKIPQNESADGLATPPVKRFTVTLPQGMSFSPSFADGLQSCSLAQIKLGTNEAVECPDASRIGEVSLKTPLLPQAAEGSMYLAAQGDNPFGSLFALYLVLHDTEERGALIKIPGKIEVDPATGQITTTFDETPQFPFEDLTLKFRSGPRAPLINPPTCGSQTIGVEIASYAQPGNPVDVSNTYQVNEGPNGTPCPGSAASRPFAPKMSAGTLNPSAGTYSPFVFRLSREDSEQELSRVTTILPPGLVAKIAGIAPCSDQAIASISTEEGAATRELNHPACPAASQIGTISAGLGAGPSPNYFPGKVYLAGPYKGAPLSLAIVAPGLAGPFDLGNVVVRAALNVDRTTAQVTAVSDSFPTILHGVILRVRDVRLRVDRANTTLNPTSCSPMRVGAQITGVGGDLLNTADDSLFSASSPFQVGDCAALAFKPSLALQLFGATKRGAFPRLRATLKMPAGGANIGAASVALPHSEFLAQEHIRTVCTRVQFAANACPADSIYGTATAKTPLFGEPLSGPVILRSSSNPLPDMVAVLKGPASQPIEVDLVGRIDSVNGGIRNTFDVVPDAPVETFTLDLLGGKKGLLVNSTNLCRSVNRATAKFSGQNGKAITLRPALQSSCKKPRKKKAKAAARHRRAASTGLAAWLPRAF